jgi:glycosyltransferase involved in cell wall biosynthesis
MHPNLEVESRQDRALPFPHSPLGKCSAGNATELPHILYLIDQFTGTQSGGAERALASITQHLPADRFRCSVATFSADPNLNLAEMFSCSVHVLPLRRTYDWNAIQMARRLRQLIRTERVTIVHSFFETADLWGGTVAKLSGCPLLVSSRRDMGILRLPKHDIAYRLIRPWMDLVVTVSEEVRSFVIDRDGMDPGKVVTLYNGVDMSLFGGPRNSSALRFQLGLQGASHIISTVGHIRRVKGLDVFIRAADKVRREFPGAAFLIVGDCLEEDHRQELQQLTRNLGLAENVRFLGGHPNVRPFLDLSDVFCLLSRSEGFSMALIEAMARSLPCVATRVGGNAEAIEEGRSGFVVENEDVDAAADRILHLLRDPEQARQMGAAGREIVERRFTVEAMIAQLVGIYDRLLQTKGIQPCTPLC